MSALNNLCPHCQDTGYVLKDNWTAQECMCLEQKRLHARLKNSLIPDEFQEATFHNYSTHHSVQKKLLKAALQYINQFPSIHDQASNSLGFIAKVGEQKIRSVNNLVEKRKLKERHNSFGLGKTHLKIAIAKHLMKQGISVLVISDATFMDELMNVKMCEDQNIFSQLLETVTKVPVLVWDDIGKANPSEAKKSAYFRIINDRCRKRRPILFSSNEDLETLAFRIGDGAASRLFGMSEKRLYLVEGPDYRMKGKNNSL
ncbi:IstB-like ATP binding protein [Seinonella peptonophila]|uniref:IstB-like ATP binding protein n=1 Tax=Seinonella peptonophila TaxID=112248 RepID=A0A1M5AXS8_9BACL|nr:ATP-binding protein [Seinonella peptonophila]SHF35091.1 IstB-like ATP binding protein [Seinonella peptonophila]